LVSDKISPRNESVLHIDEKSTGANHDGAIRVGPYKLLKGYPGCQTCYNAYDGAWRPPEMGSFDPGTPTRHPLPCSKVPCVYNVIDDPLEKRDLAAEQPVLLRQLLMRYTALAESEVTMEAAKLCITAPDGCLANLHAGRWAWHPWMGDDDTVATDPANGMQVFAAPNLKPDSESDGEAAPGTAAPMPLATALMTIFNLTGGPYWGGHQGEGNRGWGGGADPCTWAGVCCRSNATAVKGCVGADTTAVTGLNLGYNNLTGVLPPDPAVWGALPRLRFLSARSNMLSGSLPAALRLLTAVEDLNLRRNRLSGTLPSAWGPLQRLRHFSISVVNFVSGSIPASFGSLRELGEGLHRDKSDRHFRKTAT
jgi:hypothetical protein